jgi:hypothetical protein
MEDLRRVGRILWYRDYERGKIVVLKVFDSLVQVSLLIGEVV